MSLKLVTYLCGDRNEDLRKLLEIGLRSQGTSDVRAIKRVLNHGVTYRDKYAVIRCDEHSEYADVVVDRETVGFNIKPAAHEAGSTYFLVPNNEADLRRLKSEEQRLNDENLILTAALEQEERLRMSEKAERQKAEGNLQIWKDHNTMLKKEVEQRCLDTGRLQGTINNLQRECRYLTNKQEVIEMTLKAQGAEIVKRDVILDLETALAPSLEVVSKHLLSWHAMQQVEEHEWRLAMTQHLTELETMTRGYCFQDEWEERRDLLEAFYCETRLLDSEFKDLEEKVTVLVETANSQQQLQTAQHELTTQLSAQQEQLQQQAAEIQQLKAMLLARTTPRIPEGFKLGMPKAVNQTHEATTSDDGTVTSTTLLPHEEVFDDEDD